MSSRPTAVGGFLLGGLAIVVAAILFFGGHDAFLRKSKAVVFFEGSVSGLARGAAVTFRGVHVGVVSNVRLVIDPTRLHARIPVYLELDPHQVNLVRGTVFGPGGDTLLPRLIDAGLRAKLVSQSLVTGQMLIELDLSPHTPAHLDGGADPSIPEIPAIASDLQELRDQLTHAPIAETVTQVLRTFAAIEKVADQLNVEIGPLAASARHALDSAGRTMDVAGLAIQHLERDTTATLDEARGLARDGRKQLAARGDELGRTLADADKALQAINGLMVSVNGLVAPRSPARNDLEAMLRDLAASAGALRDFSQTIDRDPSAVLRGRASR